ncbi:MAG TPA: hypothetical protein VJ827_04815 [Rubrobacter sp.]|nr:hypothetical protein [Rubrobacter sp.]
MRHTPSEEAVVALYYETYVARRLRATLKRRMAFDPDLHVLLGMYDGPGATADRWPKYWA